MNKKIIALIAVVLLVAVIVVIKYKGSGPGSPELAEGTPEKDRATLTDTSSNEVKVYEAFHRLARAKDPQALSSALEKVKSDSRIVREGAANALGYFTEDEAFAALMTLLDDPEHNVRIRTLQALANAPEEKREEAVLKYLARVGLTERENTMAHATMLRLTKDETKKKNSIEALVKFSMAGDELEHYIAYSKLLEVVPNDENVLKLIRYKVWKSKNDELIATGVRHLGTIKDKWLKDKLDNFVSSPHEKVRTVAVATLHQYCPSNRWKILNDLVKAEKSPSVLDAVVREASILGGQSGKNLIDDLVKSGLLLENSLKGAQNLLDTHTFEQEACP
jgi:HEAT repeat protein